MQVLDEQSILTALGKGRTETLDWLPGRASVDDIAALLAAMANTRGGMLLLGIGARGDRPVGVDDVTAVIDRVLQAALLIEPPLIIPLPQSVRVQGATLIVAQV